jgi:hypothetical protein
MKKQSKFYRELDRAMHAGPAGSYSQLNGGNESLKAVFLAIDRGDISCGTLSWFIFAGHPLLELGEWRDDEADA